MTSPTDPAPKPRPAALLDGAPAPALLRQALPLALILSLNGLLGLADAVLLGRFVGAKAMAAVSLAFPVLMLINALAMIVGGGMAGRLSRHLGAGERARGAALLAGGHGLALALAVFAIAVFALAGWRLALPGPGVPGAVARESWLYLAILVGATPVQFLLAVQADAFRAEGGPASWRSCPWWSPGRTSPSTLCSCWAPVSRWPAPDPGIAPGLSRGTTRSQGRSIAR